MGADLHIHIMTDDMTEDDFGCFFNGSMGSKYFHGFDPEKIKPCSKSPDCEHWKRTSNSPAIWIGEASWLKAMLFEDAEKYIPHPVGAVADLFRDDNEIREVTPELIDDVYKALMLENQSDYYSVASAEEVRTFLKNHIGKQAFTISW